MIKKTLILLFLISKVSYSQVQKIFYVDDVKTIDYVTVNFCVNDSARINKVSIIENKTTYKNKHVIEQLITYLKTIQYYPDSKLRNNCYDSTFEFVNKEYQNIELKESDYSKCEKFKTGKFKYLDVRFANTKIKRRTKIQREKSKDFKAKYKVTWVSPCEYEMKYLKVKGKENQYMIGKIIKVKMIGILNDSYIYESDFLDKPKVIGEMKKIN